MDWWPTTEPVSGNVKLRFDFLELRRCTRDFHSGSW
jgi:hypothetical protein